MKVLMSGTHGMIGSLLAETLRQRGEEVTPLVRTTPRKGEVGWDLNEGTYNRADFEGFDAFVHLAGVNIGEKRLTDARKQAIWDSRILPTTLLSHIISELHAPPSTFLCASAVGYYGSRGDTILTEDDSMGEGFFAQLCAHWEEAAQAEATANVRYVQSRSGVVIDKSGGSLARQLPLFRMMLGGPLGSGRQWMSWTSLDDEIRALLFILDNSTLSGPVNITSPEPVTNMQYTTALAHAVNRVAVIPTPRPLLKLALGETLTDELLLTSQRVLPRKLLDAGFEFNFPLIEDALRSTLVDDDAEVDDDETLDGGEKSDERKPT